jgi:D-alanyl-D-alanine-carboxypeptidase/D-alanyl-D-alanine-endopeptidase
MRLNRYFCVALLALAGLFVSGLSMQSPPSLAGDYAGVLAGALHLKLHIRAAPDGSLGGTLDSVDQGAIGIPCADFHIDGNNLSFGVPSVKGSWKGTVAADGASLSGTWNQGSPMALNFTRDTFVAAEKPSAVDGIWLGTVQAGGRALRAQIKVKSDRSGREFCTFDSLDQGALDLECASVTLSGPEFSFEVPKVGGRWSGKLSTDNQTLTGSWTQGGAFALNFSRQTAAAGASAGDTDPAMPPVKAADLESVLRRDLAAARTPIFRPGPLSEGTGGGIAIGVVQHGVRRVFAFGAAQPDSIFEIGSISKTFTALMLARMVAQGEVKFDEPVRELLPDGAVPKPTGAEITLLDLATQHSGLPRMPDNFHPADPRNPYADYRPADLYRFLASHGVARPAAPEFLYSNLGFGLLGQALVNRAGKSYAALLQQEVAGPLGLKDTLVSLSPEQQARFIQGHDAKHRPAHAWDLDALAGAGAVRSTAADMLTYLEAQLHPDKVPELAAAISQTHVLRADSMPGMRIGLAWLYVEKAGFYWHNGGTGGFSSYAFFDPKNDCAGVVLFNTTLSAEGSFADVLGAHVRQRLIGEAPVSLDR